MENLAEAPHSNARANGVEAVYFKALKRLEASELAVKLFWNYLFFWVHHVFFNFFLLVAVILIFHDRCVYELIEALRLDVKIKL